MLSYQRHSVKPPRCLLQDLLSQTSHYSERVRKDALTGMAELLARYPEELRRQVAVAPSKATTRYIWAGVTKVLGLCSFNS